MHINNIVASAFSAIPRRSRFGKEIQKLTFDRRHENVSASHATHAHTHQSNL